MSTAAPRGGPIRSTWSTSSALTDVLSIPSYSRASSSVSITSGSSTRSNIGPSFARVIRVARVVHLRDHRRHHAPLVLLQHLVEVREVAGHEVAGLHVGELDVDVHHVDRIR